MESCICRGKILPNVRCGGSAATGTAGHQIAVICLLYYLISALLFPALPMPVALRELTESLWCFLSSGLLATALVHAFDPRDITLIAYWPHVVCQYPRNCF